jgi:hypothetical protein
MEYGNRCGSVADEEQEKPCEYEAALSPVRGKTRWNNELLYILLMEQVIELFDSIDEVRWDDGCPKLVQLLLITIIIIFRCIYRKYI